MVIIHIAHIDSSVIGGVQVAVPQMIKAQSQYASVGFINTYGDTVEGIQMLEFIKVNEIKNFPAPFNAPDLVVFHEVYRVEYIGIYKAIRKANIPYIIIPHGCLSKQAQRRKVLKKIAANLLLFNAFIRSARYIQYLSENEAGLSAFSKYPFFICGNGIRIPEKKKNDFFYDGIRIVYIGRLEIRTKGLDLLLEAIKKCEATMRQNNAYVEIYGPDYNGEHDLLRNMIENFGISDLVKLDKEKMGKEKENILLSADCFVQASRTEGLPMGTLEALGYGVPCIVTDGVGLGRIIESYGAGCRCETSARGLANAIRWIIGERENIKNMSIAAVHLIENNFDRNLVAKETVDRYKEMIKSK